MQIVIREKIVIRQKAFQLSPFQILKPMQENVQTQEMAESPK